VLKPVATVELVMQDETGSTSAITLFAPSSLTYTEIDTALTSVVSIFASLSGAVLVTQRVRYKWVPDEPVSAAGSSPITRTGIFFFSTGPSTPDALVSVPSLKDGVVLDSGPSAGVGIDLSNVDVIAFGDAVVFSGASNPFGDVFELLFAAYIQSRV
jgi:hypothetical protein